MDSQLKAKDWLDSMKIQKSKISSTDPNKISIYPFSDFFSWKSPHDDACHFAPNFFVIGYKLRQIHFDSPKSRLQYMYEYVAGQYEFLHTVPPAR